MGRRRLFLLETTGGPVMDITAFRRRIGLSQAELAEKLGLATPTVGNLCSPATPKRPSYEVIEKMFLLGATIEEVFSREVQEVVLRSCAPVAPVPPDILDNPDFVSGMEERFSEFLKKKGLL